MKRTQIQLDERTYRALRQAAHDRGQSMSRVVRDAVARDLQVTPATRKLTLEDFTSIGIASRDDGALAPVSERHDEALGEALYEELRDDARRYVRNLRVDKRKRSQPRARG